MGFSLTSPSGLFTNMFLHVSINNQIILINRKEAYASPNSSTKPQTTKKAKNKKRSNTPKSLHTFASTIPKRYYEQIC
jgi:hypothetical protein